MPLLLDLLLFGPLRGRGWIIEGALVWSSELDDQLALNSSIEFRDYYVRIRTLDFVVATAPPELACAVMLSLLDLTKTPNFTREKIVMFSLPDRQRHRCWQAICALCPKVLASRENYGVVDKLAAEISSSIARSCQAPERILRCIAAVRTILHQVETMSGHCRLLDSLVETLSDPNNKVTTIQSATSILVHVILNISASSPPSYCIRLARTILPHISGPLMVRMVAQTGLSTFSSKLPPSFPQEFSEILACISKYTTTNEDTARYQIGCLPFLALGSWVSCHPEGLFHHIPRLFNFSLVDVVSIPCIRTVFRCTYEQNYYKRSFYSAAELDHQISELFIKRMQEDEVEEDLSSSADDTENVQRKVIPWGVSEDGGLTRSAEGATFRKDRNHLVVVASLVERIPNLGGLCR